MSVFAMPLDAGDFCDRILSDTTGCYTVALVRGKDSTQRYAFQSF